MTKKNWFTKGNIGNVLFFAAVLIILFVPGARALVMRGLMAIGFFQPGIEQPAHITTAPNITFRDSSGKTISLSALKGKVVFINFWATWCPPCLAELPSINALHQKLSSNPNVVFLMVDVDNQLGQSVPFIKAHDYALPVYAAVTNIPSGMLTGSIPTTVVLNKQGQMVFHHEGAAGYGGEKFLTYMLKLAAEKP